MAADFTQETILDFLRERGGKVKNTDLIEHFKAVFPEDREKKAAVRNTFKNYVDNVAFVKTESSEKYVCLRKKFLGSAKEQRGSSVNGETDPGQVSNERNPLSRYPSGAHRADCGQVRGDDAEEDPALPRSAGQPTPGSGYGNDSGESQVPPESSPAARKAGDRRERDEFVCVVEEAENSSGEMGNRESFRRGSRESKKEEQQGGRAPEIPDIAVIEASPLPAEGSMFTLPGPVQTGTAGQVDTSAAGLNPRDRQVETLLPEGPQEMEQNNVVIRHQARGSQRRARPLPADEGEDEQQSDAQSLSEFGSEGSPKGSRQHFIEVMMNSSPQVRRSMVLRSSVSLSNKSDSDSLSLTSFVDDDRASVTLDPLEHEWMMCASDGEWSSLHHLLDSEPSLVLRKDFVTGFTCLHWAAKHGKPELIALIINFAKQHNVPISVDVRSNSGYTPLHIAAMHNHMEVVKLLVGAYNADVELRDYSGRKACQYLTDNVSVDIRDIIGAYERSDSASADRRDGGRWRFSKVLQSNLRPSRLLSPSDCDSVDGEVRYREKPVRRKSSFRGVKPKLDRLRLRTSQIVHSVSFRDTEELQSLRDSFRSRPKTHFFG
ncbi:ankyrin repeat domain-containing protein SOWAHC-like [Acanthopagrus latus]|uniref:ankyrin repeat domain-containing protein SOWAHC-like n=1 Tax=Acanthopagrus latus TaxID=8177 RepID=UPI00187C687A|nr:ankyrin repeat domain-containing protein SOWAHC-like [Acanthopagrus latus]XP_036947768.1 ankyrin repeat domain-containing protein SOWAHC-like [Acanthopagrus latus]